MFIALRPTNLIGFRLQQRVECVLYARAHCLVDVATQLPLIDSNRALQRLSGIVSLVASLWSGSWSSRNFH